MFQNYRSGSAYVNNTANQMISGVFQIWWFAGHHLYTGLEESNTHGNCQEVIKFVFVYQCYVSTITFFLNLIIFVMRHYCYTVGSLASSRGSVGSSESPDNNNYLRVSTAFGQRRLSDNVLNAPGHRRLSNTMNAVGSPCVSSPGSAPNTPIVGFPIRRHSSAAFAQNRRYSSNALLSPSTGSQVSKKGILQTNRYG